MDTSHINKVKAPQHLKTPRSHGRVAVHAHAFSFFSRLEDADLRVPGVALDAREQFFVPEVLLDALFGRLRRYSTSLLEGLHSGHMFGLFPVLLASPDVLEFGSGALRNFRLIYSHVREVAVFQRYDCASLFLLDRFQESGVVRLAGVVQPSRGGSFMQLQLKFAAELFSHL